MPYAEDKFDETTTLSSSGTSASKRIKSTQVSRPGNPTSIELEIAECITYVLANPFSRNPLLVWRSLRILPLISISICLFPISACSSDVERLFPKASYSVNPRINH